MELRESDPRHRVIVALDTSDADAALRLADSLRPQLRWVKVGLQLFGAAGPDIVRKLSSLGLRVFLDLKFHDIPNTMAGAVTSAAGLGARLMTVHAGAGNGVAAAAEAARAASGPDRPAVVAVTVLTSHAEGELGSLYGSSRSNRELVVGLGRAAISHGADGLVASPLELGPLREALGPDPVLVIPGIRPTGADRGDQARVATPAEALRAGADFLVIGRPITRAESPRDALSRVLDEMSAAV